MSGQTPWARSKSTGRGASTPTPTFSMIARAMRISPSVCESSGERFRVQLRNTALRSEKSHRLSPHNLSCFSLSMPSSP